MLPRQNRLVRDSDFKLLFKVGKQIQGDLFRLSWLLSETSQLGLVVSNKISKKATERNRIKRVVREFFRSRLPTLPYPLRMVVVAKSSVLGKTKGEMLTDLENSFGKVSF